MKRIIATCLAFLMFFQIGYSNGMLKKSTTISVKNTETIDSQQKKSYQFVVSKDVKDSQGNVVIAEGASVAVDLNLKSKKSVGKSGLIDVKLKSVEAVNGEIIELTGGVTVKPDNSKGKVLGVGLGVGLTLFPLMLLYLIKKGDAAILPQNTTITGNPLMEYTF